MNVFSHQMVQDHIIHSVREKSSHCKLLGMHEKIMVDITDVQDLLCFLALITVMLGLLNSLLSKPQN